MRKRLLLLTAALFALGYCQALASPADGPVSVPKKTAPAKKTAVAPSPVQQAKPQLPANELTAEQVVQLVQAGLPEDLTTAKIKKNNKAFDLSAEQLLQLKKAGASDNLIRLLMDPTAQPVAAAPTAPAAAAPPLSPPVKPATPPVAQTQVKIKTPDGEKVRLILMQDLSSSTAHEGDRVDLSVAEDIKVGENIIIAKGAVAEGRVAEVKKKRMLGQGGKLLMSIERVRAIDGQNLRLRATSGREGDDKLGKTVVIGVLAGPLALLVKGKDVESPRGTEYTAYLDESREIVVLK